MSISESYGAYYCAYDIWTTVYADDEYVVFYIYGYIDNNYVTIAYVVNKSRNEVVFYVYPDSLDGGKTFLSFEITERSSKTCAIFRNNIRAIQRT